MNQHGEPTHYIPEDCAANGGPTLSRVRGCINDEMKECTVCKHSVVHDFVDHSFFGFAANCPYKKGSAR